jgi:alpha-methylacyl-CoA racemase
MADINATARGGPLAGLMVIEMAGLGPCPLAGQLMADLGAEVTVIERKSGGPRPEDVNNRGKRSVALNLKHPDGVAACMALIKGADVLIEGFRPGVMEKLGLGPAQCHGANRGLVFGRMTGWGQDGPMAQVAGHDINYFALTGMLGMTGEAGRPPVPPLNLVADYGGGTMFLLLGVMAALFERQSSGRGQVVDAAMIDGVSAFSGIFRMMGARGMWQDGRARNLLDGAAPFYRCYETSDGKFLSVGPLEPQFFAIMVEKAGLPADHLATQNDPRTWQARSADYAAVFASRSRDDWMAVFEGTDACIAPVLSPAEAEAHPHNVARRAHIAVGGISQPAPAPRFDRTPAPDPAPANAPGADTEAALTAAGLSAAEIAALRDAGALA